MSLIDTSIPTGIPPPPHPPPLDLSSIPSAIVVLDNDHYPCGSQIRMAQAAGAKGVIIRTLWSGTVGAATLHVESFGESTSDITVPLLLLVFPLLLPSSSLPIISLPRLPLSLSPRRPSPPPYSFSTSRPVSFLFASLFSSSSSSSSFISTGPLLFSELRGLDISSRSCLFRFESL